MRRNLTLARINFLLEENLSSTGLLFGDTILVTDEELAQFLGLSARHIRRLVLDGLPKNGTKYPFLDCVNFYIKCLQNKNKTSLESKDRLLKAKAEQEEIELKKLRGNVVDVEDVKSQAMQAMQILKEALFALPSVLSPKLEKKEKEEIYTILNDAVKKITNTIADKIQEQINANESNIFANTPKCGKDEDI